MKKSFILMALGLTIFMNCKPTEDAGAPYIGPSDLVVEDGKMTPEVLLSLGRLSDPQVSPDGKTILYGVSYTSIEEDRSCRNLFLISVDGGEKVQLTSDGRSISNARWSLDGKSIFFLQGGQIWTAPVNGAGTASASLGKRTKLSDIPEGIGEFSLSPDQTKVMFISTVPSNVTSPADSDPKLDKAKAYVTEDLMYRHWDHWVTELPHSFVAPVDAIVPDKAVDILGGPDVKFELPLEPYGGAEQLAWSPDGKYIAYACKKLAGKEYAFSTDTEIYLYDVATGETVRVSQGGGYDTDPAWSPDGKYLAWVHMDRNGYEADQTKLAVAELSYGAGMPSVAGVTVKQDCPWNVGAPLNWTDKGLFCNMLYDEAVQGIAILGLDGGFEFVTEKGAPYDFGTPFAISGDRLLTSYASMNFPTELVAVDMASGAFTQLTHENDHLLSQLKPISYEKRYVKTVDGKDMLTWVLFPPEFDASKEYPAIEILLGGPQGTLSQGWSYRWNYRLMASQGYVVVLPNRRGTTAFGQEWCEQISGDYVGLNMQDYLSAARMIKAEPYVGKLAGCGASYGGFSVYYLAGIHGDVFDCFIAHAGIFDEKYMYYETEEMWFPNWDNGGLSEYAYAPGQTGPAGDGVTFGGMRQGGSPWSSSPKAVRHYANSPDVNVTAWHTPILCIHGMMDFRIPYDQGMAAFNAAQMMGVPSKLIVFPEECHWILKPQNALFWHREYFDWLDRWCR